MSKDWTGNKNSVFKTLGASNHTDKERQGEDFYATSPDAIDRLLGCIDIPFYVYEPCCGAGHLSKRLEECGHPTFSTDLVYRGYGEGGIDFLKVGEMPIDEDCCILTNPPYKYATDIIEHAIEIAPYDDMPIFMLLKTTALEGKGRWERLYSKGYLHAVFQFRERLLCAKNADFEGMMKGGGSAVSYAFFWFQRSKCDAPKIYWI